MLQSDSPLTLYGSGQNTREYIAHQLMLALNQQALYGPHHPTVMRAGEEMAYALTQLLMEEAALHLVVHNGRVLVNGEVFASSPKQAAALLRAWAQHALDQVVFRRGITIEEVITFIHLLGQSHLPEGLSLSMQAQEIHHIRSETASSALITPLLSPPADTSLLHTCTIALEIIQESAHHARLGRMMNVAAARTLASQLADNVIEDNAKLLGLLSIRRHDHYTFQHSLNICLLAVALGMAVGFDRPRLHELGLAALLHDVGKAWVPLEVLRKPGKLNDDEFALIQHHPVKGAVYLDQQLELPPAAAVVAFQHHVRYDQGGYPKLRWPHSPTAYSLIVGIADAYEALTSERPYRRTLDPEEALRVMLDTPPGQFEPRLLQVFVEMLGRAELLIKPTR